MSSYKSIIAILALCLVASVSSAPTDTADSSSTTVAPAATTSAPAAAPTTEAMKPAADKEAATNSPIASSAISSAQDTSSITNTSFTCHTKEVGYYADMETKCKVYHFCMLGDYNGQEVYQRISYLCLNETTFDQQQLDCVESGKMTAPCEQSDKHYETSNSILRKAIIGKPSMENETHTTAESGSSTTAATSTESSSTTAAPTTTTTTTTVAPSSSVASA